MATRFKVITPAADTGSVDAIVRGCERAALSFLMSGDPSAPSRYYELCPSDYPDPVHAEIYVAIGDVSEQGIEPNPLTVTNRLIAKNRLHHVGGAAGVTSIALETSSESIFAYSAQVLRDASRDRQGRRICERALKGELSPTEAHERLTQLLEPRADDSVENFDIQDLLNFDPAHDPTNLIGQRYNCQGGTSIWAGGAGYGKTSLIMQAAVYWATGEPFFGIKPVRALKVLMVQAENDFGDTAEQLQGVVRGIQATGDLSGDSELHIAITQNIVIERVIGATGARFLAVLESLVQLHKPDLVFVDPLFAFAGCDLIDAPQVSEFLREGLIPLAVRNKVCVHVVHHIGKPARDNNAKQSWSELDYQYLGFGSSEIQNAFRAVNILLPVSGHEGVFRLILSKRGSRAGALEIDGERTTSLYLERAKTGIFWSQVDKPEPAGASTRFKPQFTGEQVLEHLSHTDGMKTGAIQRLVCEETGMHRRTFYELWAQLKSDEKIKVDKDDLWTKK